MKLKKKVIFGIAAGFFAVATVFNMNMLNENGAGDVSLDDVTTMAEAQAEGGSSTPCYPYGWVCSYQRGGLIIFSQGEDNYGT